MIGYLKDVGTAVRVQLRAEGTGTIGDSFADVRPGQEFFGWTYDELVVELPDNGGSGKVAIPKETP